MIARMGPGVNQTTISGAISTFMSLYDETVNDQIEAIFEDIAQDITTVRAPLFAARVAAIQEEKRRDVFYRITSITDVVADEGIGKKFADAMIKVKETIHDLAVQIVRCYAANCDWVDPKVINESDWMIPSFEENWSYCDEELLTVATSVKRSILEFDAAANELVIKATWKYADWLEVVPGAKDTYSDDGLRTELPDFIEDILDPEKGNSIFSRVCENHEKYIDEEILHGGDDDLEDILSRHRGRDDVNDDVND